MKTLGKNWRSTVLIFALIGSVIFTGGEAFGAFFAFSPAGSGTASTDESAAGAQLYLHVADSTTTLGTVDLTFYNLGGTSSSLTDIYFDDASSGLPPFSNDPISLAPPPAVINGPGVQFVANEDTNPSGFEIISGQRTFMADKAYSSESLSNIVTNGVNNGWLEFVTLNFVGTQAGVVSALTQQILGGTSDPFTNSTTTYKLRIAVQVQDIGVAQSDRMYYAQPSELTGSPPVLPEPGMMTMWGLGLALFGGAGFWRKRQQQKVAA